jgi:nucleoside-diphosphate-sugar epimerase
VLVGLTGATGFLGGHVARALLADGWRVRSIVRSGRENAAPIGTEPIVAALETLALARAFADADVIVHAAALTRAAHARDFEHVNVAGTRAVVRAANQVDASLVLISSQAAAGVGTVARPTRETDAPRPITAYGRSKLLAEDVVRSDARVPWIIVRPSAVYGPGDRGFLPLFRWAERGIHVHAANPEARFTLASAEDVARAIVLAVRGIRSGARSGTTFFVGHAVPHTADALLDQLGALVGRTSRRIRVPAGLVRVAGRIGDLSWALGIQPAIDSDRATELLAEGFVCAVDRAREELAFTASVELADGFAATLAWYREHGWL